MTNRAANLTGFRSTVYIGLGSNMDDPIRQIQQALREIDEIADTSLIKISSLYESAPLGGVEQLAFVNAVVAVTTTLSPQGLMQALLQIESHHRRVRGEKNGPRTLDLDILVFNEWCIESPDIVIPHPRAHERAFVLHPLLEIAPDVTIPGKGFAREYLPAVAGQVIRRLHDVGN